MFTVFAMGAALVILGLVAMYLMATSKGRRSLLLALRSLWLHKMRAFLSVLGIIIGTGAVIALMAFGEGSKQDALADIARLGATNIIIRSVKPPDEANSQKRSFIVNFGLTRQDYESFELIPTVIRMVPMRIFPQEVRRLDKMVLGRVVGTTRAYADVNQLEMAVGRFLVERDDARMENVCVLGWEMAQRMFPYEDPIGESVRLGGHFYRVVGVCQPRMPTGGTGGSQAAEEYDQDVYIPLQTSRVRFGDTIILRQSGSRSGEKVFLHQITLTVQNMDAVRPTGDLIREMLLLGHQKQDWAVTVPLDKLEEAERTKNRFNQLMVMIGSISLFVGGIGIMNIMLATVTERTREIGIRRALGAKRRDITLQFLVEAMVQTSVGGMLGTVLGLALAFGLPFFVNHIPENWAVGLIGTAHLPANVHLEAIFWAIFVSVGVGVLFGWYPANRAAQMDPIEALRHV